MSTTRPLQNRVAPDGEIHAAPARGTLMGNRGGRPPRTGSPDRQATLGLKGLDLLRA